LLTDEEKTALFQRFGLLYPRVNMTRNRWDALFSYNENFITEDYYGDDYGKAINLAIAHTATYFDQDGLGQVASVSTGDASRSFHPAGGQGSLSATVYGQELMRLQRVITPLSIV